MSFNRNMLSLAKEAKGLTQGAIALHAGVSQSLLSKIENGLETSPSAEFLRKAAAICEVPTEFFYQPDQVLGESLVDLFHRRRKTLPAKPLRKANAVANIVRLEATRLLRGIELDDLRPFPSLPLYEYESPAEVARIVRMTWRVPSGPLLDLTGLIEAAGIPVFTESLGHEKLSAVSMPGRDASAQIIVLNSDLPPSAQRFALAHELGHLVMHTAQATPDMEREADQFASALLMPSEDIRRDLRRVRFRDLGPLKAIWHVSLAALIFRAHDLGEITDRHYQTLNMSLNKLPGGKRREPGEFPPESPSLMHKVVDHYLQELHYSTPELAALVVSNVASFQRRYLHDESPRLILLGGDARSALSVNKSTGG